MIRKLIEEYAPTLQAPEGLNREAILWAIYQCEKYNKDNRVPRFEPAYAPGGHYYDSSTEVRQEFALYGAWASCSYSNFQILYMTAYELGYRGAPLGLDKDPVAILYVVKLLNARIFARGVNTPDGVADAYNSGSARDANRPWKYMKKFRKHYYRYIEEKACLESTSNVEGSSTDPSGSPVV